MKSFTDYLLEKKLLTSEKLVEAIIEQLNQTPSLCQIAFIKNIFTANELLRILRCQQDQSLDFFSAAREVGLLNSAKRKVFEEALKDSQPSITSILIKKNFVEINNLVGALDEFLSTIEVNSKVENFVINKLDEKFIPELENSLSGNNINQIYNVLTLIKQNPTNFELVNEFTMDVIKNIRSIRGFAKATKATIIDNLCSWIENATLLYLRNYSKDGVDINRNLIPAIEQALFCCTQVMQVIVKTASEKQFIDNNESINLYNEIKHKLGA